MQVWRRFPNGQAATHGGREAEEDGVHERRLVVGVLAVDALRVVLECALMGRGASVRMSVRSRCEDECEETEPGDASTWTRL